MARLAPLSEHALGIRSVSELTENKVLAISLAHEDKVRRGCPGLHEY